MMAPNVVREYVKAEPFHPFRINMASGKTFDVRHPEMIKILKSHVLIFSSAGETAEFPEEFQSASLMLAESIAHLEVPAR